MGYGFDGVDGFGGFDGFGRFNTTSSIMSVFGIIIFVLVIGLFIYIFATGISTWNKNNHSPRLTVDATIVAKRTNVTHYSSDESDVRSSSSTTYYVTFQVESGDRMELYVSGEEYGMLAEGDFGKLSFQGTRYLGFERR